jgi:Ca2+-binding EF-hand superfamily protein
LGVEGFLQDKKLREWVKAKIVELKNQEFEEMLKEYDLKVKQLNMSEKG